MEFLPELVVARIPGDHVVSVRLKQITQDKKFFRKVHFRRGRGRCFQKWIVRCTGNVVLQLDDQRGHQVERLVHAGKFLQQFHHAVIIFERVQAHPGQTVLARNQVLVIRLVHVPEKQEPNGRSIHLSINNTGGLLLDSW